METPGVAVKAVVEVRAAARMVSVNFMVGVMSNGTRAKKILTDN
jgi:hypothetical protein